MKVNLQCTFTVLVVSAVFDSSFGSAVTGAAVSNDNCSSSAAISSSLNDHNITSNGDILYSPAK